MNTKNYYLGGEITLPRPWKAYFFIGCTEWNDIDDEDRFMDLAFALDNGFNLLDCVDDNIRECDMKTALCHLIASLRYRRSRLKERQETTSTLTGLALKELVNLFRVELQMRFSYQTDGEGNLTFFQKYIGNSPLTPDFICRPTGWHEVTEERIVQDNPWRPLAETYQGHDLYSTTRKFFMDADWDLLNQYNETKKNENHKYHLEIPAEPWQGNPLKAQIIILSLNPGWQEECNKGVAEKLPEQMREEVFKEKQRTLLFQAEGFFPFRKDVTDAISRVGENYWRGDGNKKGRLSVLKPDSMDEFEFYKKFAVVQYCAYTSKEYGGGFKDRAYLPSQKFTKELIRHIAYNRPEVKFVILRAVDKWKNLLDPDVWYTMKANTIIAKHPIQQRFNAGNLGEKEFEEIQKIIKH